MNTSSHGFKKNRIPWINMYTSKNHGISISCIYTCTGNQQHGTKDKSEYVKN